jgi:hypothetical protein
VITKFVAIKPGERFIELRFVRIIFDSAFEEIFAKREIFALRFYAKSQTRL